MAYNLESVVDSSTKKLSSVKPSHSRFEELVKEIESEQNLLKESMSIGLSNNVTRISTVFVLSDHIRSLQSLRDTYIKQYILDIRNEIRTLWDLCFYGDAQRSRFEAYNSESFTSEILVEHENELKELQECYALHKDLYKLASKREKLWNEKIAFENPSDGCARFENRGGALLKESKKYQNAEKQLPLVEKEIKSMVKSWEIINNRQFVVHGMQYVEYMEKQKHDYKEEREAKRNAKKAAKQEEIQNESSVFTDNNSSRKSCPSADQVLQMNKQKPGAESKDEIRTSRRVSNLTPKARMTSDNLSSAKGSETRGKRKPQRALSNMT